MTERMVTKERQQQRIEGFRHNPIELAKLTTHIRGKYEEKKRDMHATWYHMKTTSVNREDQLPRAIVTNSASSRQTLKLVQLLYDCAHCRSENKSLIVVVQIEVNELTNAVAARKLGQFIAKGSKTTKLRKRKMVVVQTKLQETVITLKERIRTTFDPDDVLDRRAAAEETLAANVDLVESDGDDQRHRNYYVTRSDCNFDFDYCLNRRRTCDYADSSDWEGT
ncbi:hypothetical protein K435DRAFT_812413 [Dendrothele bispora CBS 962.96]|uniref:Uncharacterized protein n=1 Tax=Dendrothele bispora (strain CBS 962.96) TaxID=1314807 RepID=A0A4V4HB02_DENBC|nr:hypothetical protein K435DRAFT_812413 [Dendrothele bispora CBS 962.96]